MNSRRRSCWILSLLLAFVPTGISASSQTVYELQELQAATIYNLLLFTSWTNESGVEMPADLSVCIVGSEKVANAFDPVVGLDISGRRLEIRRVDGATSRVETEACSVVFISSEASINDEDLAVIVARFGVLTIGDREGFLEKGGIINLVLREHRLRFEVNQMKARKVGIAFRAKLLRLALRVKTSSEAAID